jgi:ribonuclease VapC
MPDVVLDASAILAVLFREAGAEQVAAHLPGALVSTVNLAETITKLCEHGMSAEDAEKAVSELHLTAIPFSAAQARVVGALRGSTRAAGLSLGDRACLALGIERQAPIITGDRGWRSVAGVGWPEIIWIR